MFKFTIREAILMTTIVAVLLMWWLERSQNLKYESRLTAIETRIQAFPVVPTMALGGRPVPVSFTVLPPAPGAVVPVPPSASAPLVPGTTIPSGPVVRPGTITTTMPSDPPPPVSR